MVRDHLVSYSFLLKKQNTQLFSFIVLYTKKLSVPGIAARNSMIFSKMSQKWSITSWLVLLIVGSFKHFLMRSRRSIILCSLYNNFRWLSRGKVLDRLVACLGEIRLFMIQKGQDYPQLTDMVWHTNLMYFYRFCCTLQ